MDDRFAAYNTHLYAPDRMWETDIHLRQLKSQPYLYEHPLMTELPRTIPGIYTIGGGRQTGKTTLLKQWVSALIETGVPAESIIFYTGELIDDHHTLVDLLHQFTSTQNPTKISYIIIDEITYVDNWDKGIKFAADAGYLHNSIVILTGSDLILIQSARMTFPGRRGKADKVDFHIYSLSFKDFLELKGTISNLEDILSKEENTPDENTIQILYQEFNNYLKHGGYLTAINDLARENRILPATLKIYSDWVRGDMLKRNKEESYLKETLNAILKSYNKQVSWHSLADSLSIDSHKTVADYCNLLSSMDAVFIQNALLTDKLVAAPKKNKKLSFTDPFIYHAINQWINPSNNPYEILCENIDNPKICSELVKSVVSNQFRRYYPTYYIKSEGEIDVAYVYDNKYWPIEIKWRNQLRPNELKHIQKHKNSKVFC